MSAFPLKIEKEGVVIESEKVNWGKGKIETFNQSVIDMINDSGNKHITSNMTGVVFPGDISFNGLEYSRHGEPSVYDSFPDIKFNNSIFGGKVEFKKTFNGYAKFDYTQFNGRIFFDGAEFQKGVSFKDVTFNMAAYFKRVKFRGSAIFSGSNFKSSVNFSDSIGYSETNSIQFDKVIFQRSPNFRKRKFSGLMTFRGTIFNKPPDFRDCKLPHAILFDKSKFLSRKGIHDAAKYSFLKQHMEKIRDYRAQQIFFALEQESLSNDSSTPFLTRLASKAYKELTNYGTSFVEPLVYFVMLQLSALLFYIVFSTRESSGVLQSISDSLKVTFMQILKPFSKVWDQAFMWSDKPLMDIFLTTLGIIHFVGTIALTALFLLAVRRKFKLS